MIRAEDTILKGRINLIDRERQGDEAMIRQISKEEAIILLQSLLSVLIPESGEKEQ